MALQKFIIFIIIIIIIISWEMAYFTSRSQVWLNSRLKQRTTPKFEVKV